MKDNKTKKIVMWAVTLAVIFVAFMLDKALSSWNIVSGALCALFVTFTFCYLDNSWSSGIVAFVFMGLMSIVKELIMPGLNYEIAVNPLVAILPRLIAGTLAFSTYRLMLLLTKKAKNKRTRQVVCIDVATLIGLLANTVCYLSAIVIYENVVVGASNGLFALIKTLVVANIVPEYLASLIGVPMVVLGVRRGLKLGLDGNNWKKVEE